jgi:xanthine dehydrogenase molybdopterin-binding subunit B
VWGPDSCLPEHPLSFPFVGGQKHFTFETQTSLAVPQEDGGIHILTSTQAPSDTHTVVSKVTGPGPE